MEDVSQLAPQHREQVVEGHLERIRFDDAAGSPRPAVVCSYPHCARCTILASVNARSIVHSFIRS